MGEEIVRSFPGLGSAGYQWFAYADDPRIVRVERTAVPLVPGGQGSRDEQFVFVGLAPGLTTVRFEQRRSFEQNRPPHQLREITIRVTGAGNG